MSGVNDLIGQAMLATAVPIVLITVVSIIVVFIIVRRLMGGGVSKQLLATGQTAQAAILRMWDTGVTINDNPRIGMLLEVRPPSGTPFQAEVKQTISRLQTSQYQPGQMLEVKYDPTDHKKVAITAILAGANMMGGAAGMTGAGVMGGQANTAQLEASLRQQDELNQQIIATGKQAQAKVLLYQPMGINVNGNNPYVMLSLEVHPTDRDPFMAQAQGVIAEQSVPKFQPGSLITVRYDPTNIARVSVEHS